MLSKFFLLHKPFSISSFKFIYPLKREFKKVGHSGTLDPFATGLLVVAVNKATKFLPFLPSSKEYFFSIQFGFKTDSDDLDGILLQRNDIVPSLDRLLFVLPSFLGEIVQTPSKFSALKINGRRAYSLARQALDFELPSRRVFIHSFDLLSFEDGIASFKVVCSKGTYIRSLASDISSLLGVLGCVVKLHRSASDGFFLSSSDFSEVDLTCFFNFYPSLSLSDSLIFRLKNGQILSYQGLSGIHCLKNFNGVFQGLVSVEAGLISSLSLL